MQSLPVHRLRHQVLKYIAILGIHLAGFHRFAELPAVSCRRVRACILAFNFTCMTRPVELLMRIVPNQWWFLAEKGFSGTGCVR